MKVNRFGYLEAKSYYASGIDVYIKIDNIEAIKENSDKNNISILLSGSHVEIIIGSAEEYFHALGEYEAMKKLNK